MVEIEKVEDNGELLAMIVKGSDYDLGTFFPTSDELPFQLGLHNHQKGKSISPHRHFSVDKLENLGFSEVFYVVKGKIKLSVYDKNKVLVKEIVVVQGDIAYLLEGHGMEFLEDSQMFEIKQGPYRSKEKDKEMI